MSLPASLRVNAHLPMTVPPPRSVRLRRWALGGLLAGLLAAVGADAWRMAGLRGLAAEWRRAHDARDLAALEALYCWDGVAPALRERVRLVLLQEFDLPVRAVGVERCTAVDRLQGDSQRANLEPTGVVVVEFASADGLGARLLAGGSWSRPRLVVLLPAGPAPSDSGS